MGVDRIILRLTSTKQSVVYSRGIKGNPVEARIVGQVMSLAAAQPAFGCARSAGEMSSINTKSVIGRSLHVIEAVPRMWYRGVPCEISTTLRTCVQPTCMYKTLLICLHESSHICLARSAPW